jgi:hypothetical protein
MMKRNKRQAERQEKVHQDPLKDISSKEIRTKSGETIVQYPAEVGYHGTDKEKRLNPEE